MQETFTIFTGDIPSEHQKEKFETCQYRSEGKPGKVTKGCCGQHSSEIFSCLKLGLPSINWLNCLNCKEYLKKIV